MKIWHDTGMKLIQQFPVRKTVILALISILIIFIIFKSSVNIGDFSRVIQGISWFYFFIAFATIIPIIVINVAKWYLIVRAADFHVSFKKIFKIIITSSSLGILPGRLGDFARSYPLRHAIPLPQAIGTIVLEKILDISVLLAFSGIGLFILEYRAFAVFVWILSAIAIPSLKVASAVGKKILPKNRLTEKIHDAFSVLNKVKERKKLFLMAVTSSCANGMLSMFQIYWLFKAVGAVVPFFAVFAFQPLSMFAGLLPITLAGVGTRDSAIIYFFSDFAASEQSLAVGIFYGMQSYWIIALLGLPLLYYFFKQSD